MREFEINYVAVDFDEIHTVGKLTYQGDSIQEARKDAMYLVLDDIEENKDDDDMEDNRYFEGSYNLRVLNISVFDKVNNEKPVQECDATDAK